MAHRRRSRARARVEAVHRGEEVEVLEDRQVFVEREPLRDVADAAADFLSGPGDVEAVHRGAPLGRGEQAAEDPDEGGLARAVRAEQAEDLAAPDLQRDVVERADLAEIARDRRAPRCRVRSRPRAPRPASGRSLLEADRGRHAGLRCPGSGRSRSSRRRPGPYAGRASGCCAACTRPAAGSRRRGPGTRAPGNVSTVRSAFWPTRTRPSCGSGTYTRTQIWSGSRIVATGWPAADEIAGPQVDRLEDSVRRRAHDQVLPLSLEVGELSLLARPAPARGGVDVLGPAAALLLPQRLLGRCGPRSRRRRRSLLRR